MDNTQQIAVVLSTTISLFGIWAFVRWPYRHYRTDRLRDELFEIRANLFRLAAGGALSFGEPAYGMLRQVLNGFIRIADNFGLASFIALSLTERDGKREQTAESFKVQWRESLERLDADTRLKVRELESRLHKAIVVHIVLNAPLAVVVLIPVLLCVAVPLFAARSWKWFLYRLNPYLTRVDSAALKIGEPEAA